MVVYEGTCLRGLASMNRPLCSPSSSILDAMLLRRCKSFPLPPGFYIGLPLPSTCVQLHVSTHMCARSPQRHCSPSPIVRGLRTSTLAMSFIDSKRLLVTVDTLSLGLVTEMVWSAPYPPAYPCGSFGSCRRKSDPGCQITFPTTSGLSGATP